MRCIVHSETPRECEACGTDIPAGWVVVTDEVIAERFVAECDSCVATLDLRILAALWGARVVSAEVVESPPPS